MQEVEKNKKRILSFLAKAQEKDGSFSSYLFENGTGLARKQEITFFTSLIIEALGKEGLSAKEFSKAKEKAAIFLLSEKQKNGAWNYWKKSSKERKTSPYPDDLDDTMCALGALSLLNELDGKMLAQAVMLLTKLEISEGGPYRTWLVGDSANEVWKDVDIVVNSNIGYFLNLQKVYLPRLEKLVEQRISSGKFLSPYYVNACHSIYFISRFYRGKRSEKLVKHLLNKQKGHRWGNLQDTALAVSALINLGYPKEKLQKSIKIIESESRKKFEAYPFLTLFSNNFYVGDPALTAAFCYEAISKFYEFSAEPNVENKKVEHAAEKMKQKIYQEAERRFASVSREFKEYGVEWLKQIKDKDKDNEITLLPFYFALGLKIEKADKTVIDLGLASLYGWLAYTIYDNFMDGEAQAESLPLGNYCNRRMIEIYSKYGESNNEFMEYYEKVLKMMDESNFLEIKNHRVLNGNVPKPVMYKGLVYKKSFGHVLSSMCWILNQGYSLKSSEAKNMETFFEHYITAKQICDDAHDWEDDLKADRVNSVSAVILGERNKFVYEKDIKLLKRKFWKKDIYEVSKLVFGAVKKARTALKDLNLKESVYFDGLLSKFDLSMQRALEEAKKTDRFIKAYK